MRLLLVATLVLVSATAAPLFKSELIFPLESWHNHSSSVVELPNGDLLVCWFHGSGERTADDVKIEGARKRKGAKTWSPRFTMAVQISDDEAKTWKWKRHLEFNEPGQEAGSFHYPSIIQAKDASLHASYSYHLSKKNLPKDVDGDPAAKSIKHAHFNEAWVMQGDAR